MVDYEKGANRNLVQYSDEPGIAFRDTGVQIDNSVVSRNTLWTSDQIDSRIREALNGLNNTPNKNNISDNINNTLNTLSNIPGDVISSVNSCRGGCGGICGNRHHLHPGSHLSCARVGYHFNMRNPFKYFCRINNNPPHHHFRRYFMDILHPVFLIKKLLGKECLCKKCLNTSLFKIQKQKMRVANYIASPKGACNKTCST